MQYFSYTILLTAMFFFCIQTQAFCIYNFMEEGSSFYIYDETHNTAKGFKKTLGHNGAKECCHYKDKDCNPSQRKERDLYFAIRFTFVQDGQTHETSTFSTNCTGGGALAFYGSATDHYGICTPGDGLPSFGACLKTQS